MGNKNKNDEAFELANVRKSVITYCEGLPDLIKVHGSNSLGAVTLRIGKCFSWIGPTLDRYSVVQPLAGAEPLPTVTALGADLRAIGLEIMLKPSEGELARTVRVLKRQCEVLTELAKLQAEGGR
jgi:hypothetical protein